LNQVKLALNASWIRWDSSGPFDSRGLVSGWNL